MDFGTGLSIGPLGNSPYATAITRNSTPGADVAMPQSAEYDKRVANISLFISIGLLGLHPNSCQAGARI